MKQVIIARHNETPQKEYFWSHGDKEQYDYATVECKGDTALVKIKVMAVQTRTGHANKN